MGTPRGVCIKPEKEAAATAVIALRGGDTKRKLIKKKREKEEEKVKSQVHTSSADETSHGITYLLIYVGTYLDHSHDADVYQELKVAAHKSDAILAWYMGMKPKYVGVSTRYWDCANRRKGGGSCWKHLVIDRYFDLNEKRRWRYWG